MAESSVNSKFRLLGGGAPSDKASFPLSARTPEQTAPAAPAAAPPAPVQAEPAPPAPSQAGPSQAEPIFLSDSADGSDLLDTGGIVQPLAQLCTTREVQTPFLAAIAGPSGAGKTFALRRVAKAIEQLSDLSGRKRTHRHPTADSSSSATVLRPGQRRRCSARSRSPSLHSCRGMLAPRPS